MRFIILTMFCAAVFSVPVHINSKPAQVMTINETEAINRQILDAFKEIDATNNVLNNDEKNELNKNDQETISDEIQGFFNQFMEVINHPQNFIFGRPEVQFQQNATEKSADLAHNKLSKTSKNHTDGLVEKTREELKKDIELLHQYLFRFRVEFDEWMISNKHQNFKSMVIGASSAIMVLIFYYLLCKCCTRRSRLNHLQSFANDDFASKTGDNEDLLPTRRNRRFPSNSDEDI